MQICTPDEALAQVIDILSQIVLSELIRDLDKQTTAEQWQEKRIETLKQLIRSNPGPCVSESPTC